MQTYCVKAFRARKARCFGMAMDEGQDGCKSMGGSWGLEGGGEEASRSDGA